MPIQIPEWMSRFNVRMATVTTRTTRTGDTTTTKKQVRLHLPKPEYLPPPRRKKKEPPKPPLWARLLGLVPPEVAKPRVRVSKPDPANVIKVGYFPAGPTPKKPRAPKAPAPKAAPAVDPHTAPTQRIARDPAQTQRLDRVDPHAPTQNLRAADTQHLPPPRRKAPPIKSVSDAQMAAPLPVRPVQAPRTVPATQAQQLQQRAEWLRTHPPLAVPPKSGGTVIAHTDGPTTVRHAPRSGYPGLTLCGVPHDAPPQGGKSEHGWSLAHPSTVTCGNCVGSIDALQRLAAEQQQVQQGAPRR